MIVVDKKTCVGCGICVKSCAQGALSMQDGRPVVGPQCTVCRLCVQACPFGALSVQQAASSTVDLGNYHGIFVFAEQHGGVLQDVALELLGRARALADEKQCALTALLPCGAHGEQMARTLIGHGADRVYLCEDARLAHWDDTLYAHCTCAWIAQAHPEIVLFGATPLGRSLAPRVAARMQTGLTADCTVLTIDSKSGLLRQTRPAFGGNLMATIVCPQHRPQMATVRPGVLAALPFDGARTGEIVRTALPDNADSPITLLAHASHPPASGLRDARIILSVGRGIGSQKNVKMARALAHKLGAQLGVSRPLVDAGWGEAHEQIGQTGHSVAPDLLIACGISGAIQHLAGMGRAKRVIAINSDPDAPIFSVADVGIVADCLDVLAAWQAML